MPTKFKPDSFEYIGTRGDRKQVIVKNYITGTPKQELIDYVNNSSSKPKVKQKCINELNRRGIKLTWTSTKTPELDLGVLK
tara:strand:- start:148 stop:390 length:243 start_codon:yes stop_codon:yes gene_type:complete